MPLCIQCWTNWCLQKVLSWFLDGMQNMSKGSVAAEVLELCWEGKGHSLLLADINSLGVLNGGWKCCWHSALWRQIFHSVSGTGMQVGPQMKPHVGKGAFAQESKLLWKMFYPESHNHDTDFKSFKWSLSWPTVQPTCPARAVHQRLPACFQLSSTDLSSVADRLQTPGHRNVSSDLSILPVMWLSVLINLVSSWFVVKSFSHRDNASVSISFREMATMTNKFCSGYHSSFFNCWEAEKLCYCFF